MLLFALNYLSIVLKLSAALLSTRIRFNQFHVHYAAGDIRYELLAAKNKRVQWELVVVAAKRCMMRQSSHLLLLQYMFNMKLQRVHQPGTNTPNTKAALQY
ncbi:hypothetical protein Tco_0880550 [Tanacetum coccineum]